MITRDCNECGARDLEPDDVCACYEEVEDDYTVGGVPLGDVPGLSREEFFDMLTDDPMYGGLVDPDEEEIILIATIIRMDSKFQEIIKENQELKRRLNECK